MVFEKDLKWSSYIDYYGNLLTEKQLNVMNLYYNEDYSLNEIAAELSITRQGVRDIIVRTQNKLKDIEDKLHLIEQGMSEK